MIRMVAVTGATGYVGRFIAAELVKQNVAIRALARPGSDRGGFAFPMEWINGDLANSLAIADLVRGADAVIHLAYDHVPGSYRGGEGDDLTGWLEVNLNGSLRLLTAARDAGVPQFIFLSSRAVFSRIEPGRILDETHATAPDSHYGAYKAAVEAFLHSFATVHGMQTCAIRATGVYGLTWPPERSKWWNIINAVLDGADVSSFTRGGTEVHGAAVARAVWLLLSQPELALDILHLSDLYVTEREIVRLVREITNVPGTLPSAPIAPPRNVLVSTHLARLGVELGGVPLLQKTVAEMLRAAQASPHLKPG